MNSSDEIEQQQQQGSLLLSISPHHSLPMVTWNSANLNSTPHSEDSNTCQINKCLPIVSSNKLDVYSKEKGRVVGVKKEACTSDLSNIKAIKYVREMHGVRIRKGIRFSIILYLFLSIISNRGKRKG